MVTKNNQEAGVMFCMADLENLAQAYLSERELQRVQDGKIGLVEALMFQAHINKKIAKSRQEYAEGKCIEMNEEFFEKLRSRVSKTS